MKFSHLTRSFPVWILLFVFLAACSTPTPSVSTSDAVATVVMATMTAGSTPGETVPAPTEPLPTLASASALVVANGAPQAQVDALTAVVNELAGQSGLIVLSQGELAAGDLNPAVKVVVMAAAPSNLDQLLQAGPDTQFVVISAVDVPQEAANLSVITSNPAYETFLAGYIAEVLTDRIAPLALLPSDAANFAALEDSFLTGGRFFCGACRLLPNFENVGPVVVALPAASDAATWNASIAPAAKFGLDIVYLPAESATPETISLLASQAQRVVGNFAPPPELAGKWIATVRADASETLRSLWPDLLAGNGGQRLTARVAVTEIAARWLTPGRQRLVTEVREQLETGEVTPLEVK